MKALKKGLGSLLVAITAYVVMDLDIVKHLVLVFPELLLMLLTATLLLGCYSGYSLSKLIRTKTLAGSKNVCSSTTEQILTMHTTFRNSLNH
jgi:hypothetical protein